MNILIDADGCPVINLTLQIAKRFGVPVIILCDTSHQIEREGAQTLVFDKGADSVDFALVNRVKPGDVVVTQDYGLASMCLAKCARVLNQNGLEYTADNIDALMPVSYTHLVCTARYKLTVQSADIIPHHSHDSVFRVFFLVAKAQINVLCLYRVLLLKLHPARKPNRGRSGRCV